MTVRVEALLPDEGRRLRAVRLAALQADPDAFYRTHAEEVGHSAAFWDGWLARPGCTVVVAVDDGRDVGLAGLVPDRHAPGELAVVTFWVGAAARGRGVARALLGDLERRARAAGTSALTLEVADVNEAAVSLYAAAGFVPTGHVGAFAPPRDHLTEHERRKVLSVSGDGVELVPATRAELDDVLAGRPPEPFVAADGWPHADTLDAVRSATAAPVPWTWWVVVEGAVVGECGLLGPPCLGSAEIGFGLGEQWRGRGLGTEVVRLLSGLLVRDVGLTRVTATVEDPANEASRTVLRRNGFRPDDDGRFVLEAGPRVREVREDDLPSVRRVYADGVRSRGATFRVDDPTLDGTRVRWEGRWPTHPWLVVEDDAGAVAGWAAAQPYGARPQYDGVAEFAVYLDPAAHGRGLGRALLTGLAREGAARGLHKLTSKVLTTNRVSRALMRSVGFREVGVHHRHGRIDDEWRDVVVVELLLD